MSLKKDILQVSFSNSIILLSSIINGFVLPAVLSIEDYANLKTYTLFASFIGLLHFGFVDGINVKYGGLQKDEISSEEFKQFHIFFITFQLIVTILVIILGFITNNIILIFTGITILPVNLRSFFLFFFQAVGNFKSYTKLAIIAPLLNIVFIIILVIVNIFDYTFYITAQVVAYFVAVIFTENAEKQLNISTLKFINKLDRNKLKVIFSSGIYIMLGNILFVIFFDVGRWISKLFMNDYNFATYTFGMSLIGFITIFINAITQSFYPYFSRNQLINLISKYKSIFYVIGSFSILSYFIIVLIVQTFIPKYTDSLILTGILLTSVPGILIVKTLYVNFYKVLKKEKQFFYDTAKILTLSIVLNLILFYFYRNTTILAISATISIYIWIIFPPRFINYSIKNKLKELIYIFLIISSFVLIITSKHTLWLQVILMLSILIFLNILFFKTAVHDLIYSTKNLATKRIKNNK